MGLPFMWAAEVPKTVTGRITVVSWCQALSMASL